METVAEMIGKPGLWAGLHQPQLALEQADIVVAGIPYDKGVSFRGGAGEAPQALRNITYTIAPTTEYFEDISSLKIKDVGDFTESRREILFEQVAEQVAQWVEMGKFFTLIGGDHSVTIPILQGIDRAVGEDFGILHLDAHFDLCDTLEGDRFSHGSTQRRALELAHISGPQNQFFAGIRSVEMDELSFLQNHPAQVISASQLEEMGVEAAAQRMIQAMQPYRKVYLTIDIDCLDPAYAGGTGTPQMGGLSSRQLLVLLRRLSDLPLVGFDLVEIAPKLDPSLTALFAGRKIVTEMWGHYWRKTQK